jgi:hypothetical protein
MCKTGSKLGQMTKIFGVGNGVSAKPGLVLSAGKGENDAIDAPQVFGIGKLGGTTIARYLPWQVGKAR